MFNRVKMLVITGDRDRQSFSFFYSALGAMSQKWVLHATEGPHTLPGRCVGCVLLMRTLQYHARSVRSRICCASRPQVPQMRVFPTPCDTALARHDLAGHGAYWRGPCNDTNTASYRWRVGDAPRRHTGTHSIPPYQQPANWPPTAREQATNSLPTQVTYQQAANHLPTAHQHRQSPFYHV